VIEDLADPVSLLDRHGRGRAHIAGTQHRITALIKGRGAKAPRHLRAHPLGQAEFEKHRAQALDSTRPQPEVCLHVQDPPRAHHAMIRGLMDNLDASRSIRVRSTAAPLTTLPWPQPKPSSSG